MKDSLGKKTKRSIRNELFAIATGLVLGFFYVAGYTLEKYDNVNFGDKSFYFKWILVSGLATILVFGVWKLTDFLRMKQFTLPWTDMGWYKKINQFKLPLGGYALILFLLWIPAWLSIFPGAFAYDAPDELRQIAEWDVNSHHPVLHVLWLGGFVQLAYDLTGSYNLGIAIYTVMQMILLAFVFGYTIKFLEEENIGGAWRLATLLFYGLSPVVQLFSISATKDTMFAGVALLFLISVYRLTCKTEQFWVSRRWRILFVVSALFTMILRNNGLYIAVLTLIGVILGLKNQRKRLLGLCGIVLLFYLFYIGPVYKMLGVQKGGVEEMLSVPLQQLARVHYYDKESIEDEDLRLMYDIVPEKNWEAYRPSVSDFVKVGFQREAFQERKADCLRLWIKLGLKKPMTYLNSILLGTVDFWYPHAIVDGYRDVYGRSSFFDYQVCEPGKEIVLLKGIHQGYEYLSTDKAAQTIPGIFLLISQGWYLLISMVVFLYLWSRKEYQRMAPMMILVWNMMTVLLGPVALVRYVLILFYVFPVLPVLLKRWKND